MADYSLREYRAADVPALSLLWQEVFGDPPEFTAEFFAALPDMGSAVVAEAEGELLGAACVINGFELVGERRPYPVVGYIYGVMTSPACRGRGIGSALSLEAAALAEQRGSSILCTLPAEAGLYDWYHSVLGFTCVLHRERLTVACAELEPAMALSSTEYMLWRDTLLDGQRFLRPSHPTLEFQRRLCSLSGGGFYACGSGICIAERDGELCVIRELITRTPEDRERIAASVGQFLGAKKSVCLLPALEGEPYIAALPGSIPADCVWSFSFD